MQSKYVAWYDHHLVLLISISKASSWSPSSPAWHLDLHHSIVASRSSRQLLLLQLSLTHSDKVKKLHGECISYNKETTIRVLPVADKFTKHDHLIHQRISHHNMPCKKSSSTLLLHVFSGCYRQLARTVLNYAKTTMAIHQVCYFNLLQRPVVVKFDSTKVGEIDTRQAPLCKTSCILSVEPVSWTWSCKVGPGRFIQQYRRIKIIHWW